MPLIIIRGSTFRASAEEPQGGLILKELIWGVLFLRVALCQALGTHVLSLPRAKGVDVNTPQIMPSQ